MLEYLDTIDSDSDFIPESDTDDTSEEEEDATPPAAHPAPDSEEDDMDDDNCREILSPEQPLTLPFQFQELSGPKHMPPPDSPPIAYFRLFFTDLIITLMVTESNKYAQQVISSKAAKELDQNYHAQDERIPGLYSKYGHHQRANHSIILVHSLFPSHPMVWGNVYQASHYHLLRFLHLVNSEGLRGPGEPDCDPCVRYQPLVDHANRVFRHHYTPHQEISVDESLVGTENKTSLMQYVPNKHQH
jgi:hypothetical protein